MARMQLKCRVRRRFADESRIRERYERYISKAVIDGTINYTPISFNAIYSVCAQNLARIRSYLTFHTHMKNHEAAWNKSGVTFVGITTILAVDDASVLDCVTVTQFHLFTNRNWYSGKIDVPYVIRRSDTAATIYAVVHTVCLTL